MTNEKKQITKNTNRGLYFDLSYTGILIFFLFRIPLTNIIGNEGNGYFSVAWEIYTLFGLLFGHGIYNITKNMVRLRIRKNQYHNSTRVLSTSLIISFLLSVLGGVVIYFYSNILLNALSMKLSGISLRLLGILLIFSSVSGVFRGYFEGCGTKIPTSFSKIVEAFVAGTGAIIFASILYKYGAKVGALLFNMQYEPAFGSMGIAAGCICGSIFAFIFLLLVNTVYQKPLKQLLQKEDKKSVESLGSITKEFLKLSFITLFELVFFKLFRLINMSLYIKAYSNTDAKGKIIQYLGSYHGKVLILTGILIFIILSTTGRNIKKVEKSYYRNKIKLSWQYFCDDLKQILIFAIPATALVAALAKNLLTLLYNSSGNTEVFMLQLGAVNILLVPVAIYLYKLLSNLDFKLIIITIPLLAFILQTMVTGILVKQESLGALCLIISDVIFWFLVVLLELLVVIKTLKFPLLKNTDV
ncbi:MAG: oligosaccharide flippase family protein [Lachnospiraceae bacterium]|nr:oligosaccharide flippase family protein [Lachnospiraceae bacterium]